MNSFHKRLKAEVVAEQLRRWIATPGSNAGATPLGELTLPDTGGATQYRTVSREVEVPAGTLQFGLYAATGGFDLDWWKLTRIA